MKKIKKGMRNLKLDTNGLEIEAMEQDCTILDAKQIIALRFLCHVLIFIWSFIAVSRIIWTFLPFCKKHLENLMVLWEVYSWSNSRKYHFDFYKSLILKKYNNYLV